MKKLFVLIFVVLCLTLFIWKVFDRHRKLHADSEQQKDILHSPKYLITKRTIKYVIGHYSTKRKNNDMDSVYYTVDSLKHNDPPKECNGCK